MFDEALALRGQIADRNAELVRTRESLLLAVRLKLAAQEKLDAALLELRDAKARAEAVQAIEAELERALKASGFSIKPNADLADRLAQFHQAIIVEHGNAKKAAEIAHASVEKARAEERARVVKRCEPIHEALNALAGCMPNKVYIYGAYGELWSDYLPDDVDEFEEVEFSKLAEFPEVTK